MQIGLSDRAEELALELLGQLNSYISAKSAKSLARSMHKGLSRIDYPGNKSFLPPGRWVHRKIGKL